MFKTWSKLDLAGVCFWIILTVSLFSNAVNYIEGYYNEQNMFWGSAPNGIYECNHTEYHTVVNGSITFPLCEHYPGGLHGNWKSLDVFNDGYGWYKVALIENKIREAWRIYL